LAVAVGLRTDWLGWGAVVVAFAVVVAGFVVTVGAEVVTLGWVATVVVTAFALITGAVVEADWVEGFAGI
jgi:hypothetical protein